MNPKQIRKGSNDLPKLAAPAHHALAAAGFTQLEQLTQVTEAELLQLHGMGMKGIDSLRQALRLIETEHDLKYRKKDAGVWRK